MEERKLRDRVKDNPVRTANGITGLLSSFLLSLVWWVLEVIPETIPVEVKTSGSLVLIALVTYLAQRVGKWLQREFTEPKEVLDNIIRQMEGEKLAGTEYAKARATNDTDPHGPALEESP